MAGFTVFEAKALPTVILKTIQQRVRRALWLLLRVLHRLSADGATVAMLILDARRDDPVAPIISPGGYLRGMTRAWLQGHLNMMGSLIGLSERRRRSSCCDA